MSGEPRLLLNVFKIVNYRAYPRMLHCFLYGNPFLWVQLKNFLHEVVKVVFFLLLCLIKVLKIIRTKSLSKTFRSNLSVIFRRSDSEVVLRVEEQVNSLAILNHVQGWKSEKFKYGIQLIFIILSFKQWLTCFQLTEYAAY